MKFIEAKELVLELIRQDLIHKNLYLRIDERFPDSHPGKFILNGKVARTVHPFGSIIMCSRSPKVMPIVVSYEQGGEEAAEMAHAYNNVELISVVKIRSVETDLDV